VVTPRELVLLELVLELLAHGADVDTLHVGLDVEVP
jgi:hypothetical protein